MISNIHRWISGCLLQLYTECGADIRSLATGLAKDKKVQAYKKQMSDAGILINNIGDDGVPFYHNLVKIQNFCYMDLDDAENLKGYYDFDMDWMINIYETYVETYGEENAKDGVLGNTLLHVLIGLLQVIFFIFLLKK